MSDKRFRGQPPPPPPAEPSYKALRCQRDGPLDLTFASDTVTTVMVHYVTSDVSGFGTSMACWQHDGVCPYHSEKMEWSGWIAVWDHDAKKRAVLRLSPQEYDTLAKRLGCDLRWSGRRVRIRPTNGGGGKRIAVEEVNAAMRPADLPEFDIDKTVCIVLRIPRIPRQGPLVDEQADVPFPPEQGGAT